MKIPKFIKNLCVRAACVFTVLWFLLYSVIELIPMENSAVLTYRAMLQVMAFSLLFASVNFLLRIEALSPAIRIGIHFIVTTAIFYVCFILWSGFSKNFGVSLLASAMYAVIYAAGIGFGFLFGKIKTKASKERESEYEAQFTDSNDSGNKRK